MERYRHLSTREYILLLLKREGELSTKDLQNRLELTKVAVSRQMIYLEKDGFVVCRVGRQKAGRPMHHYSLTQQGNEQFPNDYGQLAVDLMEHIVLADGEDRVDQFFARQQEKIIQKYEGQMEGKTLSEKVAEMARIQDDNGFMARWEQVSDEEYVITQYNCPYFKVADRYQMICARELACYQELLHTSVERTECVAIGGKRCVYQIRATQS
ncbi:transcriptional regulator [Brevibacillus sp. HB1.3]|uniref:helix-turn-helix transcriptional regulator n=1 Tax=Brevibacillus sp. HB1.3 TaxID=2738842 RepID=UPI001554E010|nr:metalloregulator ArsR/SmtB family transcription factor [Brevibacillus sp. HB1.3]NQF13872.1 transcriptional regulator [Brevibacillus sp. HB1.3]